MLHSQAAVDCHIGQQNFPLNHIAPKPACLLVEKVQTSHWGQWGLWESEHLFQYHLVALVTLQGLNPSFPEQMDGNSFLPQGLIYVIPLARTHPLSSISWPQVISSWRFHLKCLRTALRDACLHSHTVHDFLGASFASSMSLAHHDGDMFVCLFSPRPLAVRRPWYSSYDSISII